MAFTVVDENKHVVEFTSIRPDGKPIELRGEVERTGARAELLERRVH
jgi:hypothetical protein